MGYNKLGGKGVVVVVSDSLGKGSRQSEGTSLPNLRELGLVAYVRDAHYGLTRFAL